MNFTLAVTVVPRIATVKTWSCPDSVAKRAQRNHLYTFSQNVLQWQTRQGLFNCPFPTQLVGRASLCQVSKLVFVDTICDLIDKDQNYSIVSLTE